MSYLVPTYDKFTWQTPILDKDLVTPPVGVKGNRYIVAGNGGAWNGHIGDITYYDGSNWQFITKSEGMRVYVTDEHIYYYFNGSVWVLDNFFTATLKTKLDGIEASAVALATVKVDVDIASAISLKHTQNTDTQLDSGVIAVDGSDNLTINQNSVVAFKSENTGALVNTLYLKTGMVGIGVVPTTKLHVQVPSAGNKQALLVEQLDTTNNPNCAEINNDGTDYGLYIHQDGVLAASRHGLYIYSNAVQVNAPLVYFEQSNSSSIHILAFFKNNGTGQGICVSQTGVLATNKHALYVYSDAIQNASSLIYFLQDNSSSTASVFVMQNDGIGHAFYISQDGNLATGKYALYIDNNGTPADGAGKCIRLDGCSVANGTVATLITSLGPTGAQTTIQGWIPVNIDGTTRYIPYW